MSILRYLIAIYVLLFVTVHRLLLITIKRATMCMNQQRIKRRDMRVDGLVIELHATSIQYKNLNMPNHSLSCKCIQHQKINCQ